jgi:hypothetical protein
VEEMQTNELGATDAGSNAVAVGTHLWPELTLTVYTSNADARAFCAPPAWLAQLTTSR